MKEKFTKDSQDAYLQSIVEDIKANYSVFFVHLKRLHCGETYPEWEKIESEVASLVRGWAVKSIGFYMENISKKIEMYKKNAKRFETEEFRRMATGFPIKKNKRYLESLNEALINLKK